MKSEHLKQWITNYDAGLPVESVIMGGISEGYEIAIQECAIEIMRTLQNKKLPRDEKRIGSIVQTAADTAADLLNDKYGFSGAQVGAAKNIAAVFWRRTPAKGIEMMRESDPTRIITIHKGEDGKLIIDNYKSL